MEVLWYLPTHGDGRYLATAVASRKANHGYLLQVAQAADEWLCRRVASYRELL